MDNIIMPCVGANDTVEDSFQAFLVKDAEFTKREEYPVIRPDMISSEVPKKILPFSKAISYQGDLSETFICFYSPDKTFERVRRNPRRYLGFFKRTAGIIGFDFSIHSDMPIVKQKNQMNDNLSLSYYYGNNGVPLIPNIRCGDDELLDEFLTAVPKRSLIAIGTHGFCKEIREKCEWYCFIEKIIDELDPSAIIVYGTLNGKLFEPLKKRATFIYFDSWITERYKEMKGNGN